MASAVPVRWRGVGTAAGAGMLVTIVYLVSAGGHVVGGWLADRLGSVPNADPVTASRLRAPQLHHQGRPARLCAATGQWQ